MEQILANNGKLDDTMIIVHMTGQVYREFMEYQQNRGKFIEEKTKELNKYNEERDHRVGQQHAYLAALADAVIDVMKERTITSVGSEPTVKIVLADNSRAVSTLQLAKNAQAWAGGMGKCL